MTLLVDAWLRLAILGLAMLGLAALGWQEWRRPNRRRLALRLAATAGAVIALALLGLRPAWRQPPRVTPGNIEAALWTATTAGADAERSNDAPPRVAEKYRFKLPDAVAPEDQRALTIPDAGYLKRAFPEISALHLFGAGLEADDLESLHGWRVMFHPAQSRSATPTIRFLRAPRELAFGTPLTLQGALDGLKPSERFSLSLEGPDGTVSQTSGAAGPGRFTAFALTAGPPTATGNFLWRLRLKTGGENGKTWLNEQIGVSVVPPALRRVLMLESAPRFETTRLQRWLSRAGGVWAARTLVGREHYRFAASNGAPQEFASADAALLAKFDVVLADANALDALAPTERAALRESIAQDGLGLLILGSKIAPQSHPAPNEPALATEADFFLPWRLSPLNAAVIASSAADSEQERLVRLTWNGLPQALESQIPAEPLEIKLAPAQSGLVRDSQGHTLAAATARGRGQIALTLVRDTWRWNQQNQSAAFSEYWSYLLSRLSRPSGGHPGHWSIIGGETEPSSANRSVRLRWVGSAAGGESAKITSADGAEITVPLAQSPSDPSTWQGKFWPRREGWHQARMPADGSTLHFFVHPADAWSSLRAERIDSATKRFVALAAASANPPPARLEMTLTPLAPGWLFALFCACVTGLWIERRYAL